MPRGQTETMKNRHTAMMEFTADNDEVTLSDLIAVMGVSGRREVSRHLHVYRSWGWSTPDITDARGSHRSSDELDICMPELRFTGIVKAPHRGCKRCLVINACCWSQRNGGGAWCENWTIEQVNGVMKEW